MYWKMWLLQLLLLFETQGFSLILDYYFVFHLYANYLLRILSAWKIDALTSLINTLATLYLCK